jgi:hypothetical protein
MWVPLKPHRRRSLKRDVARAGRAAVADENGGAEPNATNDGAWQSIDRTTSAPMPGPATPPLRDPASCD